MHLLALVISLAAYIYVHFTDFSQLPDTMMSFISMFGCAASIGSYISIAMNKENVKILNNELQDIVEKCNTYAFSFYKS